MNLFNVLRDIGADAGEMLMQNIVFLNLVFSVIIVFFERKTPKSVWAWLLLLYFLPVVGFIFYLFLGTDMKKRKMFRIK